MSSVLDPAHARPRSNSVRGSSAPCYRLAVKIGLVGLPGCGKSTVFAALTGIATHTGYGSASGKANLGVVKVPDPRVDALAAIYSPKKTIYAETTFTDLATTGAVKGLDRATLNAMRDVDALCQVLRAFPNVVWRTA